jgi:predicted component of type VI protein secretion system
MALLVSVLSSENGSVVARRAFGKDARARGIVFGSRPGCDVQVPAFKPLQARLQPRDDGYFFIDLSGEGFELDGCLLVGGSDLRVTDGTDLRIGGYTVQFRRQLTPREPAGAATEVVTTATGTQTSLQGASHKALQELSKAFVGEAGFASIEEIRRFQEQLQLTLEVAMEWMGKALRGRAEFQDQFSAPVTQIYSRGMNPVKRMRDISGIAGYLLDWREERDVEQIRATLREAFTDMVRHQMGVLAGIQQLVEALQSRLDPARIEQEAGKGKKAWQRYEKLYADTFAESSKLFNELIYPSIRKGYIFSHDDEVSEAKG